MTDWKGKGLIKTEKKEWKQVLKSDEEHGWVKLEKDKTDGLRASFQEKKYLPTSRWKISVRREKARDTRKQGCLARHAFSRHILSRSPRYTLHPSLLFLAPRAFSCPMFLRALSSLERNDCCSGLESCKIFAISAPRMMCHTSQCRFKIQYFPELATLLMESRAVP